MYICLGCKDVFQSPKKYIERHNLDTPPYEEYYGCPYCGENYVNAIRCDCCNNYISDDYIILNDGGVYCEECYSVRNIEDE